MFRRAFISLVFVVGSIAIMGGAAISAYADDLSANLACDDGTNVNLSVDLTTLQDLTNSVGAMLLYPAGLTCGVSQTIDPAASSNGPHDFAVGGGKFINYHRGAACEQNFAISAHSPDSEVPSTDAGGSAHLSVPNNGTCPFGAGGEGGNLVTKVDCLYVNGNTADFTAMVTQATGTFADEGIRPGGETSWEVQDNHDTLLPAPDLISVDPPALTAGPCDFSAIAAEKFPVNQGQITVRDN